MLSMPRSIDCIYPDATETPSGRQRTAGIAAEPPRAVESGTDRSGQPVEMHTSDDLLF